MNKSGKNIKVTLFAPKSQSIFHTFSPKYDLYIFYHDIVRNSNNIVLFENNTILLEYTYIFSIVYVQ